MLIKSTDRDNIIFDVNVIFACEVVAGVIPWTGRSGSYAVPLEPHYRRIMREIRERISAGQYPPGSKLPSTRELAAEFGVSTVTVRSAISRLDEAGDVAGRQGDAVYVAKRTSP